MLTCFLVIIETILYYQVGTTSPNIAGNRSVIPNTSYRAAAVP